MGEKKFQKKMAETYQNPAKTAHQDYMETDREFEKKFGKQYESTWFPAQCGFMR